MGFFTKKLDWQNKVLDDGERKYPAIDKKNVNFKIAVAER
jgi:hypothetical protein